jgi:molecular chaperone DnaJ
MTIRDCYIILGVSPHTAMEEVRRRYRALARQYHPDHHPDDPEAAAQFRQLAEAYETIQQSRSRARAASQNLHRPRFTESDEFYEDFFGISGGQTYLRQSPGADFRYDLQISFAAALRGTQTVIRVERTCNCRPCQGTGVAPGGGYASCPQCQGRGRRYGGPGLLRFGPVCHRCHGRGKIIAQTCAHCHGQGSTPGKREYQVRIPAGIADGTRLRLDGEGGEGFRNGPPGNLEVVVHVAPDDFFIRRGNDIHCQVKVSFADAALGGYILVPTLDGYQTVRLPQGTESGWVCRFPGAGAPGGPDRPAGDQVMEIVVATAKDLYPRQRELLEELSRLGTERRTGVGNE